MDLGTIIFWIILGVIVLVIIGLILWVVSIYNRFFTLKNASEATLGQIRVAMKKRLDMIDQLLGAVKSLCKVRAGDLHQGHRDAGSCCNRESRRPEQG